MRCKRMDRDANLHSGHGLSKLRCFSLFTLTLCAFLTADDVQVTVKIMGEDHAPISGAIVHFALTQERLPGYGPGTESTREARKRYTTGSDGLVKFKGTSLVPFHVGASADGYYHGWQVVTSEKMATETVLEIRLKPKTAPVPMYVRRAQSQGTDIPVKGEWCGFDLIDFDWIAPHGHGHVAHLYFKYIEIEAAIAGKFPQTISVKTEGGGLMPYKDDLNSELLSPMVAPTTGYHDVIYWNFGESPEGNSEECPDRTILFKTLTRPGDPKSMVFGKLYNAFGVDEAGRKAIGITFRSFLNPSGTPELESDVDHEIGSQVPNYCPEKTP